MLAPQIRSKHVAILALTLLVAIGLVHWGLSGSGQSAGQLSAAAEQHGSAPLAPLAPQLAPGGFAKVAKCAAVSASARPASPIASGAPITLTAAARGCAATFRFWELDPGRRWSLVQDYSPNSSFAAPALGSAGTYKFEIDVRDASATSSYDATTTLSVTVNGCTAAKLTASTPSTYSGGGSTVVTATSSCPGTPMYRFLVRPPGGAWRTGRDYSASEVFVWTPATRGTWSLEVDVRDAGATSAYEAVGNITYTVE